MTISLFRAWPAGLSGCLLLASLAACSNPPRALPEPPRTDLAQACAGRDGWSDPAPPAHVFGNTWNVGTCGITVLLVTSPAGHVLIDGATAQAADAVLANIRAAGFDPREVRWIASSHEHFDHVGGLAALQKATGARVAAGRVARLPLEAGQVGANDPQSGIHDAFAPLRVDRVLRDGEVLALGSLRLTMHETPAHAPGSVSWTWRTSDAAGTRQTITYADSVSTISADGYRFSDHPERVAGIRAGLDRIAALPCGILLTPHPGASAMFERLAGREKLADATACRAYAEAARKRFDSRLAQEAAARAETGK